MFFTQSHLFLRHPLNDGSVHAESVRATLDEQPRNGVPVSRAESADPPDQPWHPPALTVAHRLINAKRRAARSQGGDESSHRGR